MNQSEKSETLKKVCIEMIDIIFDENATYQDKYMAWQTIIDCMDDILL